MFMKMYNLKQDEVVGVSIIEKTWKKIETEICDKYSSLLTYIITSALDKINF